eukprot:Selendium_serpulae@DN10317_c0_g1_i1.p1
MRETIGHENTLMKTLGSPGVGPPPKRFVSWLASRFVTRNHGKEGGYIAPSAEAKIMTTIMLLALSLNPEWRIDFKPLLQLDIAKRDATKVPQWASLMGLEKIGGGASTTYRLRAPLLLDTDRLGWDHVASASATGVHLRDMRRQAAKSAKDRKKELRVAADPAAETEQGGEKPSGTNV